MNDLSHNGQVPNYPKHNHPLHNHPLHNHFTTTTPQPPHYYPPHYHAPPGHLNQTGDNLVNCTEHTNGKELAMKGKACQFNPAILGDVCTIEGGFSYIDGTPCVALKINKVCVCLFVC